MIKRLVVEKLYDRFDFDLTFNEDLNLLTGRNGSGKTTLMKIMWGMLSGRIGDEAKYPKFENVLMEVGDVKLFQGTKALEMRALGKPLEVGYNFLSGYYSPQEQSGKWDTGAKQQILKIGEDALLPANVPNTLYLPTFRRGEGGYDFLDVPQFLGNNPLRDEHLGKMVRAFGNGVLRYHVFVNYTSMTDIDYILVAMQASIGNQIQRIEKERSDFVLQHTINVSGDEKAAIQAIRAKQEETNAKAAELRKPLTYLSEMISFLFKGKGIQVSSNLLFGDEPNAIITENLSSGEKQMLSFLAYCSICKNSIIFIDEPELSLSPDWQRLFIPMLLEIQNGNQYFIATHSPFIYAMYPKKDIYLDEDKGGN